MTKKLSLKQAEGRTVPQENGADWPEAGLEVEVNRYVRRRLQDGDLIDAGKVRAPKPETTESPEETVRTSGKTGGK